MTINQKLKILLYLASGVLLIYFSIDVFEYFLKPMFLAVPVPTAPPPPPMMSVEAGTVKVVISEETPWISIAKMLTTVLGTYLGIKLINKYVK